MNPFVLQKTLRDNSNDLQDFCKELKDWSNEMKRKEESLKSENPETSCSSGGGGDVNNKIRKPKKHIGSGDAPVKGSRRFAGTDYAAWEKFDVEKECERIDKNKTGSESESDELSDEFDESLKDEAVLEKEKGNKFVKIQKWDDAIDCYTKAIACYGYDPIFYANRALCFLKKEKWKEAESDCTTALQLDKTYVKAYQRRAAARVELGQLCEAKLDLEQVFKYEPKNSESKTALNKVEELLKKKTSEKPAKPVSKFTQSRQKKHVSVLKPEEEKSKTNVDINKATVVERKQKTVETQTIQRGEMFFWPEDDSIEIVEAIAKAPHLRSKVPLKRIQIKDIETKPVVHSKSAPVVEKIEIERELPVSRKESKKKSVSFADSKHNAISPEKAERKSEEIKQFMEPITSVQFFAQWKQFNDDTNSKYEYLRVMNPRNLKEVFKESLDSKTFGDILKTLTKHTDDCGFIYNFLLGLTEVKRFCTLVFFMSKADKDGVKAIADSLRAKFSEEDVRTLLKHFDL